MEAMDPTVPLDAGAARAAEPGRQRGRLALSILVGLTAVVGVIGGAVISTSAGEPEGVGLSISYAMLPLPLLWYAYWWLDRYEPEPRRYKLAAFVWGAVVAVAVALTLQVLIQQTWQVGDDRMAAFVAPLTEEPAKALFILLTFLRARRVIDGLLDGVIYAGIIGIGFAFVENIGYYATAYVGGADMKLAGAEGTTTTFLVRGVFSPFAHPLFTSAFGIAVGVAIARRSAAAKVAVGALGLAGSIGLHALWNGSLSYAGGTGFLLSYLALGGVLLVLAAVMIVARARQVRVLEQSLRYVADRGWIHPAEIPYLARLSYRRAARRYARQRYGKDAARIVGRYQRLATDMAFLHHAIMRGRRKPHGVERTYALLDAMYALRPVLHLPPALHPVPYPA